MIQLLGVYRESAPARMREIDECIRRNLANQAIDEMHMFIEDGAASLAGRHDPKLRWLSHGRRLTFRDLFDHANREFAGRRVIIANSDIYFDETLERLEGYPLQGKLLCLSRWDVQPDGSVRLFEHAFSQDAWIFEAPLPEFRCDWYMGLPGCENRLAYEAAAAGLVLENPARSIRANHLHLSQVRHYDERQRVRGPGRGIEATFLGLGAPWLWPVVAARGRLADVRATFGTVAAERRATPVFVDYACPEGAGAWVRENHPRARVVQVADEAAFHAADARNVGAAAADPDGVLCFLDADVAVAPGFAAEILARFEPGAMLVPDASGSGLDSVLICSRAAFDAVGGFDRRFVGWGAETADLRAALERSGLAVRTFPAALLTRRSPPSGEPRRTEAPLGDASLASEVNAAYARAKQALVNEVGEGAARASLGEVHRAIVRRHFLARGRVPDQPCATVVFRESMGYTVARLEPGTSSHNNEARPFAAIPPPLQGLAFTQVVASRVSPVHVQFRTAGKLYVLVGTDWDGHQPATAFLSEHGYREPLPAVSTQAGTGFEVWSLVGGAGDVVELPTQVMLVARELVAA